MKNKNYDTLDFNNLLYQTYINHMNVIDNCIKKSHFMVVSFEGLANENKNLVIKIFEELYEINFIVSYEYFSLILFDNSIESQLQYMINSINDDFGSTIKVFVGGKMSLNFFKNEGTYLKEILIMMNDTPGYFFDNHQLIMRVSTQSKSLLRYIKSEVLYYIDNDVSLQMVIKSMFKNDLNVSKASKDIYMHRNTVINKLDLIKDYTGLSIQKFSHAIAMHMLLEQ